MTAAAAHATPATTPEGPQVVAADGSLITLAGPWVLYLADPDWGRERVQDRGHRLRVHMDGATWTICAVVPEAPHPTEWRRAAYHDEDRAALRAWIERSQARAEALRDAVRDALILRERVDVAALAERLGVEVTMPRKGLLG